MHYWFKSKKLLGQTVALAKGWSEQEEGVLSTRLPGQVFTSLEIHEYIYIPGVFAQNCICHKLVIQCIIRYRAIPLVLNNPFITCRDIRAMFKTVVFLEIVVIGQI